MSGDEHHLDVDTDRRACGGFIVYFDDGDRNGDVGDGREVADLVCASPLLDIDHPDYGQPGVGSWPEDQELGRMS